MFPPRSHQRPTSVTSKKVVFRSVRSSKPAPRNAARHARNTNTWRRFETHASRVQRIQHKKLRRRWTLSLLTLGLVLWMGVQHNAAVQSQFASQFAWFAERFSPTAIMNPKLAAATSASDSFSTIPLAHRPIVVGIQAGHWRARQHPAELSKLRSSTGASAFGIDEVDVNLDVARHIQQQLRPYGIQVDILPATVPPNYQADLFLALHADGIDDAPYRRGYKSAYSETRNNPRDSILKRHIDRAYLSATWLPFDANNIQDNMRDYYAFNRRYVHSLHRNTPALVVEMGYLTNRDDNTFLRDSKRPAAALTEGILSYLQAQGRLDSDTVQQHLALAR